MLNPLEWTDQGSILPRFIQFRGWVFNRAGGPSAQLLPKCLFYAIITEEFIEEFLLDVNPRALVGINTTKPSKSFYFKFQETL